MLISSCCTSCRKGSWHLPWTKRMHHTLVVLHWTGQILDSAERWRKGLPVVKLLTRERATHGSRNIRHSLPWNLDVRSMMVLKLLKVCPDSRTAFIAEDLLKKLFSHRFFSPAVLSRLCTNAFSGRRPHLACLPREECHLNGQTKRAVDRQISLKISLYCEIVIWRGLFTYSSEELKATWFNLDNRILTHKPGFWEAQRCLMFGKTSIRRNVDGTWTSTGLNNMSPKHRYQVGVKTFK